MLVCLLNEQDFLLANASLSSNTWLCLRASGSLGHRRGVLLPLHCRPWGHSVVFSDTVSGALVAYSFLLPAPKCVMFLKVGHPWALSSPGPPWAAGRNQKGEKEGDTCRCLIL